jgi:hypothetical protein
MYCKHNTTFTKAKKRMKKRIEKKKRMMSQYQGQLTKNIRIIY